MSARWFLVLDRSTLHTVIPFHGLVYGLAVLDNELFVVRGGTSQVHVYNTNNFTLTRNITIKYAKYLTDIVVCPQSRCLYVSEPMQKVVYRYDLSNDDVTMWDVGGICWRLSLTINCNVLVMLLDVVEIKEYTPDGSSMVKKISLDKSIVSPRHSIKLSRDWFLISQSKTLDHCNASAWWTRVDVSSDPTVELMGRELNI